MTASIEEESCVGGGGSRSWHLIITLLPILKIRNPVAVYVVGKDSKESKKEKSTHRAFVKEERESYREKEGAKDSESAREGSM